MSEFPALEMGQRKDMGVAKASAYVDILMDLAPLFALAFSIFFLKGVKGLRSSCMGATGWAHFANVIISSAVGGALAVGCALLLPLFDKSADPTVMIGIVVFVSVAGVKVLDGLMYKKLGVRFIDVSDGNSADSEWMGMSQQERTDCLEHWRKRRHKEWIDEQDGSPRGYER